MSNAEQIAIVAFANGAIYAGWQYIRPRLPEIGAALGRAYCRCRASYRRATAQKLPAALDKRGAGGEVEPVRRSLPR